MECPLYEIKNNQSNERRTFVVILITLFMMIAEVGCGMLFRSMSLLADGVHMGTHAAALGIALIAYRVARIHRGNRNFSFGTGKVGVLAGYTSALILFIAAGGMVWESVERLMNPVQIRFEEALIVAVVGLIVNLVSAVLLGHDHSHEHNDHSHEHNDHSHEHNDHSHEHNDHSHEHNDHSHGHNDHSHEDHNLKAAYLHVIADAVTSIAAIVALLLGKVFNAVWLDPIVAVVGSIVIFKWAIGLIRDTGSVLLDYTPSESVHRKVQTIVESYGRELKDFHCWKIDASQLGIIMTISGISGNDRELREKIITAFPVIHCTIECVS